MNKRPECAVSGCTNDGYVQYFGRFICGECLMGWYNKKEEDFWKTKGDENAS